jgi:citrate synthase
LSDSPHTYRTGIGTSDDDTITLLGHDVATELVGKVTLGELAYWLAAKRRPTEAQRVMFEAVLVSLADHGLAPTAITARMTLYSAPDSIQGAMAAGLLGGGSRYLGVTEDSAQFLHGVIGELDALPTDEAGWDAVAGRVITERRAAGRFVPGLGHPVHKNGDPRTPVLLALAREHGTFGPHLELFTAIGRAHPAILGRTLPLNGAGVCGAVLADLDLPLGITRGFALLARCAGLLGHLAEELVDPIADRMYMNIDRNIDYQPPPR